MAGRIIFIDNLKCLAIFLVMLGHATQFLSYNNSSNNPLFVIIYSFHMPLFMALCGYFFRNSLELPIRPFFYKKSISLLLPAISWSVLKFLLHGGGSFDKIIFHEYWFLWSAYICYLMTYFFCRIFKNEIVGYFFIILISLFVDYHSKNLGLNIMMPCFVIGAICSKYSYFIIARRNVFLPIALLAYIVGLMLWYIPYRGIAHDSILQFAAYNSCRLLVGLSASLALFLVFSWFTSTNHLFSFISISTLTFYTLNCIFSDLLRHTLMVMNVGDLTLPANYYYSVLVCLIQIPLFYLITLNIRKYKTLKLIFLGNR